MTASVKVLSQSNFFFPAFQLVCTLLLKLKEWTHDLKMIDVIFIPKGEKNNNDTKLENDKECCPKYFSLCY